MCKLLYTTLRCKDVWPPNLLFTYFTVGSIVFIRKGQGNNKKSNTKERYTNFVNFAFLNVEIFPSKAQKCISCQNKCVNDCSS